MPSVCFTGRGTTQTGEFLTREVWEARARQHGYAVDDKVNRFTNYLVAAQASIDKRVSKAVSAERSGTIVLSYSSWIDLLNGVRPGSSTPYSSPAQPSRLARDIETVARAGSAGSRRAVPNQGDMRVERINVVRYLNKIVVRNHTQALVVYEGSDARRVLSEVERHCEARQSAFSNLRTEVRYSDAAIAWMGACGYAVSYNLFDPALSNNLRAETPEPPKPVAHPLGGHRRIINLDGD